MASTAACLAVLDGTNVNEKISRFGQETGSIYAVDASDCWTAALADIDNQIALAEDALNAFKLLHLETDEVVAAIQEISGVREYATGSMIYSQWQWNHNDVEDGDQIGLCWYQDSNSRSSENAASCWAVSYEGGSYGNYRSYLIKPSKIGVNAVMENFQPVDPAIPAGTKGSWIIKGPEDVDGTHRTAWAIRFVPETASFADPKINPGVTEVVTYKSSRTVASSASEESTALFANTHFHLQQVTDNFSANVRWQSEQVELNCWSEATCAYVPPTGTGATAVTTVGAILAATVALLSF